MAKHPRTLNIDTFAGINNVTPPHKTPPNYLKDLVNLDIDEAHNLFKRPGYDLITAGDFHSLWSDDLGCYCVQDGDLVKIDACDYSSKVILAGQNLTHQVDFERVDDTVYFTSEEVNGRIVQGDQVIPWSVERPPVYPMINIIGQGLLETGSYSVAFTFEYENGEESGSSLPGFIAVPDNSKIGANLPVPTDPLVKYINVYVSYANGTELYFNQKIEVGTATNVEIYSALNDGRVLRTFNKYPAPKGHLVEWFAGRVYVAQDNIIWYSDPMEYGVWDLHSNYMTFESEITMIAPVDGGLWVSDKQRTYYLQGKEPSSFKRVEKEPSSIVRGSAVKIHGDLISIENTPVGYKHLATSSRGIVVLYNDGLIINLSSKNVSIPVAQHSAAALWEQDGISKYVSLLDDTQPSNNTQMSDRISGTIVRNGVVLSDD